MTTQSPRLTALARIPASDTLAGAGEQDERCELCGRPIPAQHRHVADVVNRTLLCACQPCSVLLDHRGAGGGHYRLVPDRRLRLEGFRLDDLQWNALDIPVGLAFFFRSTPAGRVIALYPSPLGATESQLPLDAWEEVERANPVLAELEPDVEALLVNRIGEMREHFVAPIDDCYTLVATVKQRGELDGFFRRLRAQARTEAP